MAHLNALAVDHVERRLMELSRLTPSVKAGGASLLCGFRCTEGDQGSSARQRFAKQ
jgi:hypothetical protein